MEACEFWTAFCESELDKGALRPALPRVLPVLLKNMVRGGVGRRRGAGALPGGASTCAGGGRIPRPGGRIPLSSHGMPAVPVFSIYAHFVSMISCLPPPQACEEFDEEVHLCAGPMHNVFAHAITQRASLDNNCRPTRSLMRRCRRRRSWRRARWRRRRAAAAPRRPRPRTATTRSSPLCTSEWLGGSDSWCARAALFSGAPRRRGQAACAQARTSLFGVCQLAGFGWVFLGKLGRAEPCVHRWGFFFSLGMPCGCRMDGIEAPPDSGQVDVQLTSGSRKQGWMPDVRRLPQPTHMPAPAHAAGARGTARRVRARRTRTTTTTATEWRSGTCGAAARVRASEQN